MTRAAKKAKKRGAIKPPRAVSRDLKTLPAAAQLYQARDARLFALGTLADEESLRADPVETLRLFTFAIELGYFPPAKVCRVLAASFQAYLNGDASASLDKLLGLRRAGRRSGRDTALSEWRRSLRDSIYIDSMRRFTARGMSAAAAAKATDRRWNGVLGKATKASILGADEIARRFLRTWKKTPQYALEDQMHRQLDASATRKKNT
jgi:hypothetical protein